MSLDYDGLVEDLIALFSMSSIDELRIREGWSDAIHAYAAEMVPAFGLPVKEAATWADACQDARDAMYAAMVGISAPYGCCDSRIVEDEDFEYDNAIPLAAAGVAPEPACASTRIGDGLQAFVNTIVDALQAHDGSVADADYPQVVACLGPPTRFRCPMAPGIRVEAVAIVWATDIHNWFRTGAAAVQASKETPPTPPVNWS